MGKIIYNNCILTIQDLSMVKSRFSRFGTVEEPDAEENGADFFVEKQTARYIANGYGPEDAESNANSDLLRVMRKRHVLNEQFRESELNRMDGEVEYVLELDPLDGKYHLFNTASEEFLCDMIDNWRRHLDKEDRSDEFDPAEAEAINAMDCMFSYGEVKSASYMVSDISGTVRYVNQFVQGENGLIKAQYLDIGKFVRDLTPQEAFVVVRTLGEKHGFEIQTNAFGFSYLISPDKSLNAKEIHETVLNKLIEADGLAAVEKGLEKWEKRLGEHNAAKEEHNEITQTIDAIEKTLGDAGIKAVHDIHLTVAPIGTLLAAQFFHRKKKEESDAKEKKGDNGQGVREKKSSVLKSVRKLFINHLTVPDKKDSVNSEPKQDRPAPVIVFEHPIFKTVIKKGINQRESEEQNFVGIMGEVGFAHVFLQALTKPEVKKNKRVQKRNNINKGEFVFEFTKRNSTLEMKKRGGRRRIKEKSNYRKQKYFESMSGIGINIEKRKNRVQKRRLQIKNELFSQKDKLRHKREVQLAAIIIFLSHRLLRKRKQEAAISLIGRHKEEDVKSLRSETGNRLKRRYEIQKNRELTLSFSLAFSLWFLVYRYGHKRYSSQPKSLNENNRINVNEDIKGKEKSEIKPTQNSSVWIIFSIIWYLAMIREQGLISSIKFPSVNKTSRSKQGLRTSKKKSMRKKGNKKGIVKQTAYLPAAKQFGIIYSASP